MVNEFFLWFYGEYYLTENLFRLFSQLITSCEMTKSKGSLIGTYTNKKKKG